MATEWRVAAEGSKDGPTPRGMRPGRRLAPPAKRIPAGVVHAYDKDTKATACGVPADGLILFDLPWFTFGGAHSRDAFPACKSATDG